MPSQKYILWSALGLALAPALLISNASAQQSLQMPAYDKAQARMVLDHNIFYLPLFGAVYRTQSLAE